MQDLQTKLASGWELRINRDMEGCLSLCTELKQAARLPAGSFDAATLETSALSSGVPWKLVAGTALLWASVVRTLQGLAPASALVSEVEAFVWKNDPLGISTLYFEKGMLAFAHGDYSLALENFLAANTKPQAPWEKLCGRANVLFCLENLGFSQERTLNEVEGVLSSTEPSPAKYFVQGQMQAFHMRQLFRQGKIKDALSTFRNGEPNQAHYYQLWLRSLPYHSNYQPLSKEELGLFHEARFFMNGRYRVRSLTGTLHPDDLLSIRPTEFADRLYLWVWKWLLSPESFSIYKVTSHLKNFDLLQDAHRMAVEDIYLLRNSILWLGLFDPGHEKQLLERVKGLEAQIHANYPIFEVEALFIHYCRAIRDGKTEQAADLTTEMENHPLYHRKELCFRPMVDALNARKTIGISHLKLFSEHLRSTLFPQSVTEPAIRVDLTTHQISIPGVKKSILSKPLAIALDLLQSQASVTVEELCNACFGITKFDPLIHMPRIYNLLSRMKALKDCKVSFRVKDGFVVSEGDWKSFVFVRGGAFSKHLAHQSDWTSFLMTAERRPSGLPTAPPRRKTRVSWDGFLKREEVEKLLERPRSTTNRVLNELIKKGLVERKGGARHARYRMKGISEINLEELI